MDKDTIELRTAVVHQLAGPGLFTPLACGRRHLSSTRLLIIVVTLGTPEIPTKRNQSGTRRG